MANWIGNLYQQLLDSLDDAFDIVDTGKTMQSITVFEHTQTTKEQLIETNIYNCIKHVYVKTPNPILKKRLRFVLLSWRAILRGKVAKTRKRLSLSPSGSVFEAVIMNDERFFLTKSIPALIHRLLKSYDKSFRVTDMATALSAIDALEKINIPLVLLDRTNLESYVRGLRRNTTNRYLADRLRVLAKKWRDLRMLDCNTTSLLTEDTGTWLKGNL